MIVRRYGTSVQSVELNFDSKALTEIGFRRDQAYSIPFEEFETGAERIAEFALEAEAEGYVQDEVEAVALADLEEQLRTIEGGLQEAQMVFIQSTQGVDYPKTRGKQTNVVIEGENRLHFVTTVAPPLRVAVYRLP